MSSVHQETRVEIAGVARDAEVGALEEFQMAACPRTQLKGLCPAEEEVRYLPQVSPQDIIIFKGKCPGLSHHSVLVRGNLESVPCPRCP